MGRVVRKVDFSWEVGGELWRGIGMMVEPSSSSTSAMSIDIESNGLLSASNGVEALVTNRLSSSASGVDSLLTKRYSSGVLCRGTNRLSSSSGVSSILTNRPPSSGATSLLTITSSPPGSVISTTLLVEYPGNRISTSRSIGSDLVPRREICLARFNIPSCVLLIVVVLVLLTLCRELVLLELDWSLDCDLELDAAVRIEGAILFVG